MANETLNFNINGIDHPVKDPNAYVKPSSGIPKEHLSQEVQDALDGDGTVTGVKVGSTTYEPTEGVVDISPAIPDTSGLATKTEVTQGLAGKVDKVTGYGLSKNDYSDADKTKLANIEAGAEVNVINGIKANGASETLPVDQNGVVELPPAGSTISPATAAPVMDGTADVGSSAKYAREDHVHPHDTSKQDTLTFDDVPTAGHTTQVMSSDKIKTALDNLLQNLTIGQNGNWYVGQTDTGVSAQGPAGNVNITDASQLVAILVNDLTTGGAGNILSAEMGKVLKTAISTLIDGMGNYCFPLGRPTLSWEGAKADIVTNFNHVTSSNTAMRVDIGGRFETTLGTDDDLYVLDEDSVVVEMGGVDITTTAFTAATGRISIDNVNGTIEITASGMTYVQDGLVLHLDCRHRGGTGTEVSGHWKSLVNYGQSPIDFTLKSGVTAADTGMVFDGGVNSYGEADTLLNILYSQATIECVASGISSQFNTVLVNPVNKGIGLSIHTVSSYSHRTAVIAMGESFGGDGSIPSGFLTGDTVTDYAMSVNNAQSYNKGVALVSVLSELNAVPFLTLDTATQTKLTLGARFRGSGNNFLNGTVRAIRVYNAVLTAEQQLQNWIVDKKRFNIS